MKKIILSGVLSLILLSSGGVAQASKEPGNNDTDRIQNSNDNSEDQFSIAYQQGKAKGIITDENMPYPNFISLCKESVFPAYLEAIKVNPMITFSKFVADDHYEVPEQAVGDHPETITASEVDSTSRHSSQTFAHKRRSYHMRAGDILICYGGNSSQALVGHAAIATSSKYILEMPGTKHYSKWKNAHHHSKRFFFKQHAGGKKYDQQV